MLKLREADRIGGGLNWLKIICNAELFISGFELSHPHQFLSVQCSSDVIPLNRSLSFKCNLSSLSCSNDIWFEQLGTAQN